MLKLKDIAKEFEDGLNEALNNPLLLFRIWANAGQHTKPVRRGNEVTYYIDGILRPTASENVGTIIDMGAWTLELDLTVPIPPPRMTADPTQEEMQRIYNDQYNFALDIFNVVNSYFKIAETLTMTTSDGESVSVGIRAGTAIPGLVNLLHSVGESVEMTVYISLGYTEDGLNSRSAKVSIDSPGNIIPALTAEVSRANVLSSDVYVGKRKRQSIASASALSISLQLPVTQKTENFYGFLVRGELNIAHFVFYALGDRQEVYWMTADDPAQASQEVSNVGLVTHLIEIADDDDLVNVPQKYMVVRCTADSGEYAEFRAQAGEDCYAHIGGKIYKLQSSSATPFAVEEGDYAFDGTNYYFTVTVNKKTSLSITRSGGGTVPTETVQAGE